MTTLHVQRVAMVRLEPIQHFPDTGSAAGEFFTRSLVLVCHGGEELTVTMFGKDADELRVLSVERWTPDEIAEVTR